MKETSKFNRVFRGEGRDLCSSYFSSSRHRLGTYWSSCGCSRAVDRFSPFHDFFLLGTKTGRDDQNGWADEQDRHRSRDARRSGRPVRPDPSRRRGRRSQRHRRARQDAQRRPPDPGTIEREWAGTGGFLKIFVVPLQHYARDGKISLFSKTLSVASIPSFFKWILTRYPLRTWKRFENESILKKKIA